MHKYPGIKPKKITSIQTPIPYWVEIIHDLVIGAGFSYSRIAYRIKVSASTIQKLATNTKRRPRYRIFHALLCFYHKIFHGAHATPEALLYWKKKNNVNAQQLLAIESSADKITKKGLASLTDQNS